MYINDSELLCSYHNPTHLSHNCMENKIFKNTMDYSLVIHNMNQQFSIFKKKCVKIKIKKLQYFLLLTVFIIKFIKRLIFNLKKVKLIQSLASKRRFCDI